MTDRLGRYPDCLAALDIGCGGGLLAEEFARLGCEVTGVDPSEPSLETARRHANQSALAIAYEQANGEALPFSDASFDVVYCCDVLEHVDNLDRVIAETARVLRPGGVYLYDTINRTRISRLVMIHLFQDWRRTRWMPSNLHEWDKFIKPGELHAVFDRHGLSNKDLVGLKPGPNPVRLYRLLRKLKVGRITPAEFGRRGAMVRSKDTAVLYAGYAIKT